MPTSLQIQGKNSLIKGPLWLIIAVFLFGLMACQSESKPLTVPVVVRDTTITPANAYSDLFFDSLRLDRFVSNTSWHDSLEKSMLNFYNTRNYQYAWFTKQGF